MTLAMALLLVLATAPSAVAQDRIPGADARSCRRRRSVRSSSAASWPAPTAATPAAMPAWSSAPTWTASSLDGLRNAFTPTENAAFRLALPKPVAASSLRVNLVGTGADGVETIVGTGEWAVRPVLGHADRQPAGPAPRRVRAARLPGRHARGQRAHRHLRRAPGHRRRHRSAGRRRRLPRTRCRPPPTASPRRPTASCGCSSWTRPGASPPRSTPPTCGPSTPTRCGRVTRSRSSPPRTRTWRSMSATTSGFYVVPQEVGAIEDAARPWSPRVASPMPTTPSPMAS